MNKMIGSTVPSVYSGSQIRWLRWVLTLLIIAVGASQFQANAQVSAQLIGVVSDHSGAVMPGVVITVTSLTSNQSFQAKTDPQGRYSFLTLPAGNYKISASMPAFKTFERTVVLTVAQAANLNFVMEVGDVKQVVEVSASEAPLVNATDSTVGTVVEQKEIANLPLNGRNFASLITLSPGVSPTDVSQTGAGPSIQGQRNRDNSYQVDGVNIATVTQGQIVITPPLDSVEEFRVQSVNGEAEFGQSGGGYINVVTKSGTNTFKGSVYDYLRNNDLDARNTFQPSIPAYRQNQYGASLGGPVFFPRILPKSRTKTYFFLNYEALRLYQNSSSLGIVPTAAQLAGDFSGFNPIYDPYTTIPDPAKPGKYLRTQFPGNQIPASEINPDALAYAKAFFPAPNYSVAGSPNNFINTAPNFTRTDTWLGRIDQTINDKNRVAFRWLQDNSTSGSTLPVGHNLVSGSFLHPRNISIEWNNTLSPTMLLTLRYGYDRENTVSGSAIDAAFYNNSGFNNVDGWPVEAGEELLPSMSITGYSTYFGQNYGSEVTDSNAGSAEFQKIWGRHSIKVGADWIHIFGSGTGLSPQEGFIPTQTQNLESPTGTGDAFASFLLGVPTTAGRLIGTTLTDMTANFWGFFGQDTIRLNKSLTIDLGLRWDYAGRFGTNGPLGSFNQETGNSWYLTAPVTIPGAAFQGPNIGSGILAPEYTDFGPRAGFAYQMKHRLVVRGGYGLFFNTVAGRYQWVQGPRVAWPRALYQQPTALNATTVQVTIAKAFAGLQTTVYLPNPFLTATGANAYPTGSQIDPNYATPRAHEYNLAFEDQITDKLVASVTYVGALGHQLDCCGLVNQAYTNGPTPYNIASRPFPLMGVFRTNENKGYSDYNGLQLKVQQNLSHGLTYLATYTYSKSTDLACSGYIGAEGCNQTQPYNLIVDHALSDFDLRHVANFSVVYELPFGRGKMFNISNRVLDEIAGGWQTSGIFTLRSGRPLTARLANATQTNIGGGVSPRPDLVAGAPPFTQSRNEFFNTAEFANPVGYAYGTAGRNILHGPMQHGENISLFKDFAIREVHGSMITLQYRADMFNAFNMTTYGNPGLTLGTTTFGAITSANPGRIIQMAARVSF